MSKTIIAAIDRFARAHERIRDLSADLPDEEIAQAYEERTEALIQLLEWDTCDGIEESSNPQRISKKIGYLGLLYPVGRGKLRDQTVYDPHYSVELI
jgi:hypothetical protein